MIAVRLVLSGAELVVWAGGVFAAGLAVGVSFRRRR